MNDKYLEEFRLRNKLIRQQKLECVVAIVLSVFSTVLGVVSVVLHFSGSR